MSDGLSDDIKNMFMDFGALSYSDEKIRLILGCDQKTLESYYDSGCRNIYKSGAERFDFEVNKKLMNLAINGDAKALSQIQAIRQKEKDLKRR